MKTLHLWYILIKQEAGQSILNASAHEHYSSLFLSDITQSTNNQHTKYFTRNVYTVCSLRKKHEEKNIFITKNLFFTHKTYG